MKKLTPTFIFLIVMGVLFYYLDKPKPQDTRVKECGECKEYRYGICTWYE